MKDRIMAIMQEKELSASQFAEAIDVQRATMSHIINGRNNPSLEIVTKILNHYHEIDPRWLLNGEGEMYLHKEDPSLSKGINTLQFPDEESGTSKNRKDLIVDPLGNQREQIDIEQYMAISSPPKKITKIMIFYTDNTFDTFVSEKSKKDS